MLEKMLGVSPPQKGLAQDSGAVDKKNLQQHSDLKKEFDQKLKEQLKDKNSSVKDTKKDQKPKIERNEKEELRADKNQKKPSGGPKKKMVEPEEQDETTISKVMASSESEVEIADQRKDLAPVETESSTENIKAAAVGVNPGFAQAIESNNKGLLAKDGAANAAAMTAVAKALPNGEEVAADQSQSAIQGTEITDQALIQKALAAKNGAKVTATELTPEMVAAFRAAQENKDGDVVQGEKIPTNDDSKLALQMQMLANQNQPVTAEAMAANGQQAVDSSSLMAKSLENLKAMTAQSANANQPVSAQAAAGVAAGIAAGMGLAGFNNSDEAEIAGQADDFKDMAQLKNVDHIQDADMLQDIPLANVQQNQQSEKALSFEQQLGAEVGFESDQDEASDTKDATKTALLQKMKQFESEKGMTPKEANSFELKVLSLLQQERGQMAHQKFGAGGEGSAGGGSSQKEKPGAEGIGEMKGDLLGTQNAPLHAGQTQTDFRTHMNSSVERMGAPLSAQAMAEHREENIQHVMNGAKLLAIKGGGEMIVKMSPDGMGPIELKVMMQDGKVNIEMQTQDKSVKKLIEDSLTELKSGLAAQKIHVEHVKIDTVNATNTDNSTGFQTNQNSSDAQSRQQEFWKNFRENFSNQPRKNSYGDVAAVPSRPPAGASASSSNATTAARNGGRTGSTINRVA